VSHFWNMVAWAVKEKVVDNEASPQQAAWYHKEGHCL
jgi:hypothetical protein